MRCPDTTVKELRRLLRSVVGAKAKRRRKEKREREKEQHNSKQLAVGLLAGDEGCLGCSTDYYSVHFLQVFFVQILCSAQQHRPNGMAAACGTQSGTAAGAATRRCASRRDDPTPSTASIATPSRGRPLRPTPLPCPPPPPSSSAPPLQPRPGSPPAPPRRSTPPSPSRRRRRAPRGAPDPFRGPRTHPRGPPATKNESTTKKRRRLPTTCSHAQATTTKGRGATKRAATKASRVQSRATSISIRDKRERAPSRSRTASGIGARLKPASCPTPPASRRASFRTC